MTDTNQLPPLNKADIIKWAEDSGIAYESDGELHNSFRECWDVTDALTKFAQLVLQSSAQLVQGEPVSDAEIVAALEAAGVKFQRFMGGISGTQDCWSTAGSQDVRKLLAGVRAILALRPAAQYDSMGIPTSCGKPLCAVDEHHPLCKFHTPDQRPAAQEVDWRELTRRLYVELFYCDQQMTNTYDETGEPMWTTGSAVRDVLRDAKVALEALPAPQQATPAPSSVFAAWWGSQGQSMQQHASESPAEFARRLSAHAWTEATRAAQQATPEPVGEQVAKDFPPMPEGWPARFRCDSCDGNGEIGELVSMGHFQPPERQTCPDCGGRGWTSEEPAFNAEHMREFAEAHARNTRPAHAAQAVPMTEVKALEIAREAYDCRDAIRRAEAHHGITAQAKEGA